MSKYFNKCHNLNELKKEHLKLIRQYHPDLAKDKDEFEKLNKICTEINIEYEELSKVLPKIGKSNGITHDNIHEDTTNPFIINGSEEAQTAYYDFVNNIYKLTIDYNFYYAIREAQWWEDKIISEIDSNIQRFWSICLSKNIIGNEFAKLFELCDYNVEKMRRTIMFLSTGAISEKDIHTNLTSNNPIPFFDDNITSEKLPDYNYFLLLSKDDTKEETIEAWIDFCQKQRDIFSEKFNELMIPKIPSGKHK